MAVVQFDVDGVLADFLFGFMRLAQLELNSAVTPVHQTFSTSWDGYGGLLPRDIALTWRLVRDSRDFWEGLPALISRQTFKRIDSLQDQHDVYFVTNRAGRHVKYQTEHWLMSGGVQRPTVVISARKGEFARAINATHAIEDKAGNAVYTAYESPNTASYLLDRAYNVFDPASLGSKVIRVDSVDDFIDQVEAA